MLLCLASTTLGQSAGQGVWLCSCHMLGGCTEQTLHVTARKFTCHGTGSAKGGGFLGAESAPNVRKYVEAAAVAVVLVGGRLSVPSSFSIPQLSS